MCNYATNYRSSAYRHVRVRHQSDNLALCRVSIQCVKVNKASWTLEKQRIEAGGTSVVTPEQTGEPLQIQGIKEDKLDFHLKDSIPEGLVLTLSPLQTTLVQSKICGWEESIVVT